MKKALTIFIVLLLVMLAARFVIGTDEALDDVRILKLAHGLNTQHPVHKTMEFLAERLKETSQGKMIVQIFPSEQLGNEKECIEALQLGYLAMTKTSTGPMESFVPRIKIFGLPYVFRDSDHFWTFALGPISGRYDATISMSEMSPPKSFRLSVQAKGLMGFADGHADITLEETGGETRVTVDADSQVGGAAARVGQRLMGSVANTTMDRFFSCLKEQVE